MEVLKSPVIENSNTTTLISDIDFKSKEVENRTSETENILDNNTNTCDNEINTKDSQICETHDDVNTTTEALSNSSDQDQNKVFSELSENVNYSQDDRENKRMSISNNESSESEDEVTNKALKKKPRKLLTVSDSDSAGSENEERNSTTIGNESKTLLASSDSESSTSGSSSSSKRKKKGKIKSIGMNNKHESNEFRKSLNKSRKRITLLESDSEYEIPTHSNDESSNDKQDTSKIVDSDELREYSKNQSTISKNLALEDSDSEPVTQHDKSFSQDINKEDPVYVFSSKGELLLEKPAKKSNNWSALCDSESSDDETNNEERTKNDSDDNKMSDEDVIKPIKYKKKPKSKEEKEPKKMSGKEAAELRKEIQSESQRMQRESNIYLPYHRPKSFTLKEFLSRRPKLASAVPVVAKTPPSVAIKMSTEQLEIISKKLEQRHKEVEEFYKSDSEADSDDEKDDSDYVPPNSEQDEDFRKEELKECAEKEGVESEHCENERGENSETTNDGTVVTTVEVDNTCNSPVIQIECNNTEIIADTVDSGVHTENSTLTNDSLDNSDKSTAHNIQDRAISVNEEMTEILNNDDKGVDSKNNKMDNLNTVAERGSQQNNDTTEKVNISDHQTSMEYEFNLDDMDENTEKMDHDGEKEPDTEKECQTSDDAVNKQSCDPINEEQCKQNMYFAELDKEIENFDTSTSIVEPEKPKSKMELLKERLANIKPRLSNSSNNLIDLDTVAKPAELTKLMERFAKHTSKKHIHRDNVKLNVINVENGGEIHKETVAIHVDDDEDTAIEEKPGVRLQKLRNELQSQIAQQREQLWQNKNTKEIKNDDEDPYKDEKSDCGADDAILDNDDEEEMSDSTEDEIEDEDEEIENETEVEEKKSAFIDDEADDSDLEDDDAVVNDEEQESDNVSEYNCEGEDEEDKVEMEKSDKENEEPFNDREKQSEQKPNDTENITPFKKPLRRILKAFAEDSDDDDDVELSSTVKKISEKLNRSNEDSNSATQDDYIPPYQPQNQKTPVREAFREKSNLDLKFCTPVSYITGLQNLNNSATKLQSPMNVPSPLKEADWHTTLQKKLFADSVITDSQAEAMENLCSEQCPASQDNSNEDEVRDKGEKSQLTSDILLSAPSNTQDLLNVCSGDFKDLPTTQDVLNVCSGQFTGISQASSVEPVKSLVTHELNPVQEDKNLGDDQDMIISQLIDEEELEAFKKIFDSPVPPHSQKVVAEEVAAGGGIIDSDDDGEVIEVKKRKKNQKKLTFSDDESSEDEREKEEEIDLHDEIEEEDEDVPAHVDYDSEENEIEYTEGQEHRKIKMADFFEEEAELSESDWGSADEDEKDLDMLEFEKGDAEKFDEKQMRTDLERIHMRRMLDDDTREVKLLQEMLLDDGELHGTGRERQFKWKNIDSLDTAEQEKKNSDDEVGFDEDESEEIWRRKRHEREMFLKEKQSQDFDDDDIDLLSSSEILKIGHKVLKRSSSNSQGNQSTENGESSVVKSTFSLVHKRGSFLSRGEEVLQRLAEYNKISTTTSEVVTQKAKNSKNFLFQTVEVKAATEKFSILNKRKATDATPRAIKKLRLTDNLSPAVRRKKKPDKPDVKARLFGIS